MILVMMMIMDRGFALTVNTNHDGGEQTAFAHQQSKCLCEDLCGLSSKRANDRLLVMNFKSTLTYKCLVSKMKMNTLKFKLVNKEKVE